MRTAGSSPVSIENPFFSLLEQLKKKHTYHRDLIREKEEKRDKDKKSPKNKTEKTKQMTLFQNLSNANHWLAYTTFLLNNNAREKTRLKMIWLLPQIIQPAPGSARVAASQYPVRDHPDTT